MAGTWSTEYEYEKIVLPHLHGTGPHTLHTSMEDSFIQERLKWPSRELESQCVRYYWHTWQSVSECPGVRCISPGGRTRTARPPACTPGEEPSSCWGSPPPALHLQNNCYLSSEPEGHLLGSVMSGSSSSIVRMDCSRLDKELLSGRKLSEEYQILEASILIKRPHYQKCSSGSFCQSWWWQWRAWGSRWRGRCLLWGLWGWRGRRRVDSTGRNRQTQIRTGISLQCPESEDGEGPTCFSWLRVILCEWYWRKCHDGDY